MTECPVLTRDQYLFEKLALARECSVPDRVHAPPDAEGSGPALTRRVIARPVQTGQRR